ncbi:MAG: 2-hydroxyacid dehydrogenase [Flavobacteriaceae bacterium]|nr:2-hydroxyacid dehydrogenase [Flavobacteriaceae bacterium]
MPKILHLDTNHPLLIEDLAKLGFENHTDYTSDKTAIEKKIADYEGIIIRSRIPIDQSLLQAATRLKFIGRVGAGLENIDETFAKKRGIQLFNAPEGNRNAVGEHALGLLLSLFNKIHTAHFEIKSGAWRREANRGVELDGKTVGIIGYGNTGKAFAKKLRGFDVEVLCVDILPDIGDTNARQVTFDELQRQADVVSLHIPQTPQTLKMVDKNWLAGFQKPFWLINTARGKSVVTQDLVAALKSGQVLGAGLDVLEYEAASFEDFFDSTKMPDPLVYLLQAPNVVLTPHVAGWTEESKVKLAQTIVDKISAFYQL